MEITATHLEENLSATVNAAARGQTFTITKHGAPVATLGPPLLKSAEDLALEVAGSQKIEEATPCPPPAK